MRSLILFAIAVLSAGAVRPDVRGRVTDGNGRPITGATAYVYTAGVKTGTSPFCPSCYPDCGKSALSDGDGVFTLRSLDPELKYRILFVADGYKPAVAREVDLAAATPVQVALELMPAHLEPTHVLKGTVVGPDGKPVLGAIVTPEGCKTAEQRWWGDMPGVDPMSVTNPRGEFLITSKDAAIAFDLKVEARGLATRNFALVPLGDKPQQLTLGEGATVMGRLLKGGKPLSGANIGLVQKSRPAGQFTGARTVGTDAQGRFTFLNVAPPGSWVVYGIMNDLGGSGAVQAQIVHVNGENTTSDAGDLSVAPSYTLGGRVILSDGRPVPPNTRLHLGREDAWDSQIVALDESGRFMLTGVPAEQIQVSVMVKGYRLSLRNRSLDKLNLTFLRGRVEGDVTDLIILLEPGKVTRAERERMRDIAHRETEIGQMRIEGVPARP